MIAADHLAQLLDQPLGDVCRNGRLLADGFLKAQKLYQSNFIIVFSDVSVEPEAMDVKLEYSVDGNPQPIQHVDDSSVKHVDMAAAGRIPQLFEAAALCRAGLDPNLPIFFSMKDPFSLAAMVIGTELFLEKLLTEPEAVTDLLDICTNNQSYLSESIIQAGYIPFVGAPIASGGLIGANYFRRFAAPYLIALFDKISGLGSFRCLHICGEIGMLTDELANLKLDVLSFEDWHDNMFADMPDTIPMGYISTNLFIRSDEETVQDAARQCLETLPEPCILSTGCDLPANADPNLVSAMMTI